MLQFYAATLLPRAVKSAQPNAVIKAGEDYILRLLFGGRRFAVLITRTSRTVTNTPPMRDGRAIHFSNSSSGSGGVV